MEEELKQKLNLLKTENDRLRLENNFLSYCMNPQALKIEIENLTNELNSVQSSPSHSKMLPLLKTENNNLRKNFMRLSEEIQRLRTELDILEKPNGIKIESLENKSMKLAEENQRLCNKITEN